jgi:hypothetical protein
MTLSEFNLAQVKAVEDTAQGLFKLLTINFFYDVTAGAERAIQNNPMLKGISAAELTREVFAPGSFRSRNLRSPSNSF